MRDRKLRLVISHGMKARLVVLLVVFVVICVCVYASAPRRNDDVKTIVWLSAPNTFPRFSSGGDWFRSCPSVSNRCRLVFSDDTVFAGDADAVLVFGGAGAGVAGGTGAEAGGGGAEAGGGGAEAGGGGGAKAEGAGEGGVGEAETAGPITRRNVRERLFIGDNFNGGEAYAVPDGMVAWGKGGIKTLSRSDVFTLPNTPWNDVEVHVTKHTSRTASELYYDKHMWGSDVGEDPDVPDDHAEFFGEQTLIEHSPSKEHFTGQPTTVDMAQFASTKNKGMAVILNDCSSSDRLAVFVAKLRQRMKVHVFGRCGEVCSDTCLHRVSLLYSFYLLVDHSDCLEAAQTEDFPLHLRANLVPVVFGGRFYSVNHPRFSFVKADTFPSAYTLADHLLALSSNQASYAEMLRVRRAFTDYEEIDPDARFYCLVCDRVHGGMRFGALKKPEPISEPKCPGQW